MGLETESIRYGDLNGDGRVNSTDYVLIRRYILRIMENPSDERMIAADLNGDGRLDSTDAVILRRMLLEILKYCPADTNQDGFVNEKSNIKYAGYFYDAETGLYYLNARFYDPETARFIQEDTYRGDILDPLSLNLYSYCHNNPIMYWDPTGHWPEWLDKRIESGNKWVNKNIVKPVVNTASNAWDTTTTFASNSYNYVSGKASDAITWTNNNVVQPTIKTVSNAPTWANDNIIKPIANKTPEIVEKIGNTAVQIGSHVLESSYEATQVIAPYTRFAMDVNKKTNPFYWAFDYATEKSWVPLPWGTEIVEKGFDIGGFYRADNGMYHAKQTGSLQSLKYIGYNNLYDTVFHGATSMNRARFPFTYDGKDYTFWAWKGDYLNLGAGAELGIYERAVVNGNPTSHWLINKDLAMPMTLTLDYKGQQILNYNPIKDDPEKYTRTALKTNKWWITGFNPYYENVRASQLTATYTVDFSDKKGMYDAFIKSDSFLDNRDKWSISNDNKYLLVLEFK
ncbi:UNVERIFIED_CONTAM: RHS repeat-associated protein [Acetivibrio alkalicellulosi]